MSAFSADWLSLREPADAAARAKSLVEQLLGAPAARQPWEIVDLGAGTGANLRYLAPLLGGRQRWRLIDGDAHLLDAAARCLRSWARGAGAELTEVAGELVIEGAGFECRVRRERLDLASDGAASELPMGGLVSVSAVLDLVSERWLRALARRSVYAGVNVLFALTYDGRIAFDPPEPGDELVRALVNRHQLTDKGFGPALGPAAAPRAASIFRELGYQVSTAPSDWRLGPDERALQMALIDGWKSAAGEIAPGETHRLHHWHARRRVQIYRGDCRLTVGHTDMLGWLPE